jgi:transglutaminase/protease-like cytokinesis protein 3
MNSTLKQHYSRSNTTVTSTSTKRTEVTEATEATEAAEATESTLIEVGEPSQDEALSNASSSRKKRCELTQSAMKKVNVHECDVVVHFS